MAKQPYICPTCGNESPEGEGICAYCGAPRKLTTPGEALSPPAMVDLASPPSVPGPAPARPVNTQTGAAGSSPGAAPSASATAATSEAAQSVPPEVLLNENSPTVYSLPSAAGTAAAPRELTPYEQDELENNLRQVYIHLRRKDLVSAREACERAVSLNTDSPQIHEARGLILEAEGNELAAYREYRLACQVEPAPVEAETRLAYLALKLPPETLALLQPKKVLIDAPVPAAAEEMLTPAERSALAITSLPSRPLGKPRRTVPPFASIIIPGLGQALLSDYAKGAAMFVVWVLCVLYLVNIYARSSAHNSVPVSDPFTWIALFIMACDYLWSVADAATTRD